MKLVYYILLSCLFLQVPIAVWAQVDIKGEAVDSLTRQKLTGVTVQLKNKSDSTLKSASSNNLGKFNFKDIDTGTYSLETFYLGYRTLYQAIRHTAQSKDILLELTPSPIELDEVVVSRSKMVNIKGDTLEYDASAFKTPEYADADELIAQIPGVELDEDGNVKAQGEQVKKVIVDGKEFFSTDPKVALKTLPADIVDKIQIIDDKSEQAKFSGFDDGERDKVINIVTKPDRRHGYFGRAFAGKGDGNKYNSGAQVNAFNGSKRFSFNLMANNINETDIHESGRGRGRRGNSNVGRGLSDTYSFAGNFNNSYLDEKMDVSADYKFRNSQTDVNVLSDQEFLIGTRANQFTHSSRLSDNSQNQHNFNSRVRWDVDSSNRIDFNANFAYNKNGSFNINSSNTNLEQTDPINSSERSNESNSSNFNFGGNLTLMHRFNKPGRTISLNVTGNKNSNENEGLNLAVTEYYLDAVLDRIDTNNNRSFAEGYGSGFNSSINYTEKVFENSQLQASYSFRNTNSYSNREAFEYLAESGELGELRDRLSNEFRNDYNYHSAGISYNYNKKETFRLQVGVNYEHGIRNNHRTVPIDMKTNASFGSFLPKLGATYFFQPTKSLEINYNTATNTPSINQLQDFINNENELFIVNGNPNLEQEYSHRFRLQYRDINRESGRSFTSNINYDFVNNKIVNSVLMTDTIMPLFDDVILGAGGQYQVPVNINGVYTSRWNNNYGVPIKAIKANLNVSANLSMNRSYAIINDETIKSMRYGINNSLGLRTNFSRQYIFGANYRMNAQFTNNPSSMNPKYTIVNHFITANSYLELIKGLTLSTDMSYFYNGGINDQEGISTTLLNATLGYRLFKNRSAEIAIKGFDLLNNSQNIQRSVSEYSTTNSTSNTLNRYFLLSFTYDLRKFGGQTVRSDGGGRGGRGPMRGGRGRF